MYAAGAYPAKEIATRPSSTAMYSQHTTNNGTDTQQQQSIYLDLSAHAMRERSVEATSKRLISISNHERQTYRHVLRLSFATVKDLHRIKESKCKCAQLNQASKRLDKQ